MLYIITVTKSSVMTRIQMDNEESVKGLCWYALKEGYTVRVREGLTVTLTSEEVVRGSELVREYSKSKPLE